MIRLPSRRAGLIAFAGACLLLVQAGPAPAQQQPALSPSLVLVVKLVSNTQVQPATGLVVADGSTVLVAAEFVSTPGELVVLDGGTDIVSHGRPAIVEQVSSDGRMAILSVKGLLRPPTALSITEEKALTGLHLEAFPPARHIAEGARPIRQPLGGSTALPYVNGFIMDACGNLAGMTLAKGAQSLDDGKMPAIAWAGEIGSALGAMQLVVPRRECVVQAQAMTHGEPGLAMATEGDAERARAPDIDEPESPDDAADATASGPQETAPATRPQAVQSTAPPSPGRQIPVWLYLLALLGLAGLAWRLPGVLRARRRNNPAVEPASSEPDTAPLGAVADTDTVKPRAVPAQQQGMPDLRSLPDGCDGVLELTWASDADSIHKRYCCIDTGSFRLVIGRGNADIAIEHPAISRSHARLEAATGALTLSDLGSAHGSFINGTPCLPGEVLYLEPGDVVFLGEIKVGIEIIRPQETDQ